ncbi:MAG: hypothetical protein H8E29_02545 [Anaerolineales bacterium]|uniref:Uncharacterized protein n=1 Tax=Candidatus Desulfolinea nitratireducens TaxID=2841698 RepID=A0A8J6NJP6_9CHLR|nr:hypothetical protein [Candidatus Desulfolinea nitratireducens]
MNKEARLILGFTLISNIIVIYAIISFGIGKFFISWWQSSSRYIIGVIVIALIWYILWIKRINNKNEFIELSDLGYKESLLQNADKDLTISMCPQCEVDCYYFSNDPEKSHILNCWNCQHVFSFAWCDKCGMGSDFIKDIPQNPSSWECPECNQTYPLSSGIFINVTNSMSLKDLPLKVHLGWLNRQMNFEKEQAATSIWLMSTLVLSYTLISPIVESLNDTYFRIDWYPILAGLISIIVFISTWYGFVLYPTKLMKKIAQSKDEL